MDYLVQLDDVSKWFDLDGGRFFTLKHVTLGIERGRHLAIVGKSGSGKTTFLNMLTGIDHPSEGSVAIGGTAIHSLRENELARWRGRNIGIVFQFFQLIPTLTISENILLAMDFVSAIAGRDRRKRAAMLLDRVGIGSHGNKLPSALSGGEQQRAAIARALANDPPVIVADEPTGNLDSATGSEVMQLFTELVGEGKTVITVTHDMVAIDRFDRVVTLRDGMVVGS